MALEGTVGVRIHSWKPVFHVTYYSGTTLLWTPWGHNKVSCIERYPQAHLGHGKVSLVQRCPYFRVSLKRGSTVLCVEKPDKTDTIYHEPIRTAATSLPDLLHSASNKLIWHSTVV